MLVLGDTSGGILESISGGGELFLKISLMESSPNYKKKSRQKCLQEYSTETILDDSLENIIDDFLRNFCGNCETLR